MSVAATVYISHLSTAATCLQQPPVSKVATYSQVTCIQWSHSCRNLSPNHGPSFLLHTSNSPILRISSTTRLSYRRQVLRHCSTYTHTVTSTSSYVCVWTYMVWHSEVQQLQRILKVNFLRLTSWVLAVVMSKAQLVWLGGLWSAPDTVGPL